MAVRIFLRVMVEAIPELPELQRVRSVPVGARGSGKNGHYQQNEHPDYGNGWDQQQKPLGRAVHVVESPHLYGQRGQRHRGEINAHSENKAGIHATLATKMSSSRATKSA